MTRLTACRAPAPAFPFVNRRYLVAKQLAEAGRTREALALLQRPPGPDSSIRIAYGFGLPRVGEQLEALRRALILRSLTEPEPPSPLRPR